MRRQGARSALRIAFGMGLAILAAGSGATQESAPSMRADFGAERASSDARRLAHWVVTSRDAHGLPFVIVDKLDARVFAFDTLGRLRGAAPALLGLARGDRAAPDIGTRRLADISPAERITPAGRFEAGLGRNLTGREILWVDYAAAVSLHRVISTNIKERRLQRLMTPSTDDNRISYGCINVPVAFYEHTVLPLFASTHGVVYVMPDTELLDAIFRINGSPAPDVSPKGR